MQKVGSRQRKLEDAMSGPCAGRQLSASVLSIRSAVRKVTTEGHFGSMHQMLARIVVTGWLFRFARSEELPVQYQSFVLEVVVSGVAVPVREVCVKRRSCLR